MRQRRDGGAGAVVNRYSDCEPSLDDNEGDLRAEFSTRCPLGACDGSGTIRERHGFSFGPTDNYDCECQSTVEDPVDDLAELQDSVVTIHPVRTKEAA